MAEVGRAHDGGDSTSAHEVDGLGVAVAQSSDRYLPDMRAPAPELGGHGGGTDPFWVRLPGDGGEDGHLSVAVVEDVLGELTAGVFLVIGDGVDPVRGLRASGTNDGKVGAERVQLFAADAAGGDDESGYPHAQEPVEAGHLLLSVLVHADGHRHDGHSDRVGRMLQLGKEQPVGGVRRVAQEQADGVRSARGQFTGHDVGHVAQLLRSGAYLAPGVVGDLFLPQKHPGHRSP